MAFVAWPRHLGSGLVVQRGEQAFGNYIKIARDGRITVAVPQVETGQGIWTALPQIVADELGAAWETVAVEPAPLTGAYANPLAKEEGWPKGARMTAGATSVRAFEQPLREAAAVGRNMLIGAAADRWNVSPSECETGDGFVINGGRTLTFGELAEEAADRSPPRRPELRQTAKARLIGEPMPRLDGPAKTDGSNRFAGDVRLPGMLFASVRIAPPGGRLTSFARRAIAQAQGVRHVTARDGWIAVVADSWWAAEHALKASRPSFSGTRAPADLRPLFDDALANGNGHEWFSRGDYDATVRGSRPLAATYYVAPSLHLGLESSTATARLSGLTLEVWAPTQAPGFAHASAGGALYPMPVGEPAGRALEADAMPIAMELARQLKRPVQVTLSQSESQKHDRAAPGALARMTALPGEAGITAAWQMRVATADGLGSALARLAGSDTPDKLGSTALDGAVPPYGIPHVRVEAIPTPLPFTPGYMRGSPQRELTFFAESFIDELARAAGMEPLAFRMSMLGQQRTARALPPGRGAACRMGRRRTGKHDGARRLLGLRLAHRPGRDRKHRRRPADQGASAGCRGRLRANRQSRLVKQQIESGLIWALAQATAPRPNGSPEWRVRGGFRDIGLPRIGTRPRSSSSWCRAATRQAGINGLATTVLAPAVANAIYSGSGKRMRSLPFDPMAGV